MRTNCSCYVLVCALIVPPPCFVFPVGVSVRIEKASTDIKCPLPVYISAVSAGFPSPAEDYIEGKLDLNEHLIARPSATFMVRATGDSMTGVGIFSGDILIVDRSVQPRHGSIIIAVVDSELTVKRLYRRKGVIKLEAANPAYPSINVSDDMELWCWGVVTASVHHHAHSPENTRTIKQRA